MEIHLYTVEHSEIGLKSFIFVGVLDFGIKATRVEFTPLCITELEKKLLIASQKSSPMMFQVAKKNSLLKPSGPGALLGLRHLRV